jgi:hypothetical protein
VLKCGLERGASDAAEAVDGDLAQDVSFKRDRALLVYCNDDAF